MRLVGFNFTRISVEKKNNLTSAPKLKTEINVTEIKELPSEVFKTKEIALELKFSYSITYDPEIAQLDFEGTMVLLIDPKEAKQIMKDWKNKELSDEFKFKTFNIILKKSNIRAIQLEDELNLPTHFQMPTIRFDKKQE